MNGVGVAARFESVVSQIVPEPPGLLSNKGIAGKLQADKMNVMSNKNGNVFRI
jgi:hypothetical protein